MMGIFGKTMNVEQEMKQVDGEAIASIIDKNMTLTGEVLFQGKARIDGTITGDISGEHLILSETGRVVGDITVSSFNCYGSLEGNIKANLLIARKNCSIQGKVEAGNLTVEPGACIQGEILAATQALNPGEANDSIAAAPTTSFE